MKVIVGDDQRIFGSVMSQLFADAGHSIVGDTPDLETALEIRAKGMADVCLVGLHRNGLNLLNGSLTSKAGDTPLVLVLSEQRDLVAVLDSVPTVAGIALEEDDFVDILEVVNEAVARRTFFINDVVVSRRSAEILKEAHRSDGWALTSREKETLCHLAAGETTVEIARAMDLKVSTVRSHIAALLRKLGARSRGEAISVAARRGLFTNGLHRSRGSSRLDT